MIFIGLIAGFLLGALGAFLILGQRSRRREARVSDLHYELLRQEDQQRSMADAHATELAHKEALLRTQAENHAAQIQTMKTDEARMKEQMTAISGSVLEQASKSLSDRMTEHQRLEQERSKNELDRRTVEIRNTVKPVAEKLTEMDRKVTELEKERTKSHIELGEQIGYLKEGVSDLADQAGGLTAALKKPSGRGSWGEIQLRNVIEMAGMVEHCDFETQVTVHDDGARLRPDVIVNMPGGRTVVVDAKVPMEAFLNAQEAADEETRDAFLARHAQQVRNHVSALRRKDYQSQFDHSPELVIMFVPSEGIYHSALAQDSTLLEYGLKEKVLIATPTTLIGVLQAINYGWGQDRIARSAQEIAEAGRELHKRILTFAEPLARVGRHLDSAAENYNQAIGSYERMVVPQLRRIEAAGAESAKEISESKTVDTATRKIVIDTSPPDPDPEDDSDREEDSDSENDSHREGDSQTEDDSRRDDGRDDDSRRLDAPAPTRDG